MPGNPVSIGCVVILSPGMAGPPDTGAIMSIPQVTATISGMPVAVQGSICQMVNSVTGAPYALPIGAPITPGITIDNMPVIRMGDVCPSGPGMMQVVGPPAAPFVMDASG